jgi:hypothetical protein
LRPALVGLSINGEPEEHVTFLQEKELDYQHNSLSFVFSAQNYAQPERTSYRYRLLNANDTTWKVVTPNIGRVFSATTVFCHCLLFIFLLATIHFRLWRH